MKVAFATRDCEHVDQLRGAPQLVVYEITGAGFSLERTVSFDPEHGIRTEARIDALAGCALLVVSAIGPSVVARLSSRGVRPITAVPGRAIEDVLVDLVRLITARDSGRIEVLRP